MTENQFLTLNITHHQDLISALKLDAVGVYSATSPFVPDNGRKALFLLKAASLIAAGNVPRLPYEAWPLLLEVTKTINADDFGAAIMLFLAPGNEDNLVNSILCAIDDPDEYCEPEKQMFSKLSLSEKFAAMIVSDHFWACKGRSKDDVRQAVSKVSGWPLETVFSDDPECEELWAITNVNLSDNNTGNVKFSYNGKPMAKLYLAAGYHEMFPGTKGIWTTGLDVYEDRPLVQPDKILKRELFKYARCDSRVQSWAA